MVLQKKIDCGFNGYDVPRATRSPRKSVFKKKSDHQNHQISSFDLLAEVAGKIMLESEKTSSTSNNEDHCVVATKEHGYDHEHMVTEETSYNNAEKRFFVSEILPKSHVMDQMLNRSPSPIKDFYYGSTSGLTSDSSEKFETQDIAYNYEETKIDHNGDHSYKTESNDKKPMLVRQDIEEKLSKNVVDKDENHISSGFMKQVTQNSSVCGEKLPANFATKSFRSTLRIGDGRIKKVLASKYCKVSPKIDNDTMVTNSDLDLKQGYIRKKHCIRTLRSERNYPIKKRRYFDGYVASQPEESIKNETHSVSPKKASGFLSSIACQKQPTFKPKDSQYVKLGIKSFRVPELFIEIPETSTIGSLKRTVMETLTTILGDGLHIGVNVHGKKVRDDNKLLLHQSGTSLDNLSDTIEFCLEPNPCNVVSNTLTRCHTKPNSCVESDIDSRSSVPNKAKTVYSRALVPFTPLHAQALTIVPPRKPKRSEVAQRRIRRPFSVSEVEALVQAVERLGTGRWRDVKMRAFEYAKHRTYVDLKDKWKTLVHTARISPQQRRGEPVPQELLDRVLTAHAYWSHQQGKQQFLEGPHKLETSLGL